MTTVRRITQSAAGYILLEAILALAVFSGIAAYQVRQQRDELVESAAKAHGQEMSQIAAAADRYVFVNQENLKRDIDVAGFANDLAPTLDEIRAQGWLAPNFGVAPMFGGGYNISLRRVIPGVCDPCTAAQCIAAIDQCAAIGLLVTTQPVQIEGLPSVKVLGRAIEELGANGGATGLGPLGNAVVAGVNNNWNAALPPVVAAQAGLVGVQLGRPNNILFNDAYLRRDGSLPMVGNLNMGNNNNINNAGQVNTNNLAVNGQVVSALNMGGNNIVAANSVGANSVGATAVQATSVDATNVQATSVGATNVQATSVGATTVQATGVIANSVHGTAAIGVNNKWYDGGSLKVTYVGVSYYGTCPDNQIAIGTQPSWFSSGVASTAVTCGIVSFH